VYLAIQARIRDVQRLVAHGYLDYGTRKGLAPLPARVLEPSAVLQDCTALPFQRSIELRPWVFSCPISSQSER